ncbi:hypothetical protein [Ruegeria sp.]|uniref:hypothetical protein n=1 Tax=Ruegeria sp. TaxID=1879320 RepID=UPI003C7AD702
MQNKYLYRIYRLRRLIIVSLAVLFAQWCLGWWFFGSSVLLENPLAMTGVALACVLVIITLVITYPCVWWETLTAGLVIGFVLILLPLLEDLQAIAPDQNRVPATAILTLGIVFGGFFLWLGLNWLPVVLPRIPSGFKLIRSQVWTDLNPDEAFQILKSKPDSDDGFCKSGPIREDGLFLVNSKINTVNVETFDQEAEVLSYYCKVEQESNNHQVVSVFHKIDEEAQVDLEYLHVWRSGRKTVCETRVLFGRSDIYTEAGFWLKDYGSDHMYGQLMRAQGGNAVALIDLPYKSPLVGLARFFQQIDNSPRNSGSGSI